MGPNPRDQLGVGDLVPLDRVRAVIANALRPILASPHHRTEAAALVLERLGYFQLLALDVESWPVVQSAELAAVLGAAGTLATYVPAGATMQTPTPPTCADPEPIPDPIPLLGYCRCLPCCCSPGEGHKSPEYLAWEARQRA